MCTVFSPSPRQGVKGQTGCAPVKTNLSQFDLWRLETTKWYGDITQHQHNINTMQCRHRKASIPSEQWNNSRENWTWRINLRWINKANEYHFAWFLNLILNLILILNNNSETDLGAVKHYSYHEKTSMKINIILHILHSLYWEYWVVRLTSNVHEYCFWHKSLCLYVNY